jgi:hypothetical protein
MSFRYNLKPVFTWAGVAANPPHAGLAGDKQFGGPSGLLTWESQKAEQSRCTEPGDGASASYFTSLAPGR